MGPLPIPVLQLGILQAAFERPSEHPAATLPVPNPTRSFWIDTPGANPLAREGSEGDISDDADICIIGAGITGVSAAYHLAKTIESNKNIDKPIKVLILEARDFCSGATGRNGGHLTPAVFLDFVHRELAYGTDEARKTYALENYTAAELVKIIESENLRDVVDLVSGGHTALFVTDTELENAHSDYSAAKAAGINLEGIKWSSKEEMESAFGTSYPAVHYGGHNLWPLKLVTELYKLAARRQSGKFSINLHTHTPVTAVSSIPDLESSARRWKLSTPRGDISCSYVIHATNAYASHLLPFMKGPAGIIPTRGQVIALRASVAPSQLTKTSWDGNEGFEYWFPRPVNTRGNGGEQEHPLIILGGGREVTGPGYEYYETNDSVVRQDVGRALRNFLPGLFPGKYEENREPEMEWTGIMGYTKLTDPFVGPVIDEANPDSGKFRGQFISAGYTGHGMTRTYACAEIVAGMVTSEITGETWTPPKWFPRHYLPFIRDKAA